MRAGCSRALTLPSPSPRSQLHTTEQQFASSDVELERYRGLLTSRAGMLSSVMLPQSGPGAAAGGAKQTEAETALRQRQLAELLSLLLDLLNWKVSPRDLHACMHAGVT